MKLTFNNRLAVLIREKQISSASEFGRRMTAAGYPMSSSHASRFEKDAAPAFDLKFITAACNVLQCLPNDLYNITIELDQDEVPPPTLSIPRQAIVIRSDNSQTSNQVEQTTQGMQIHAAIPIAPTNSSAMQNSSKSAAKNTSKAGAKPNEDTGPSGVLFPYMRNK